MKFKRKNSILRILSLILITLTTVLLIVNITQSKNHSSNEYFINFMDSYKSRDINSSNKYLIQSNLPNISNILHLAASHLSDNSQIEIISFLEEILYSINYEILSSKTLFNKSKINVNFSYYDISKYFVDFFNNYGEGENENIYMSFIEFIKNTKYKIHTNLDIEMIKKNNSWYIILSEKLINILTSGIYKNFTV